MIALAARVRRYRARLHDRIFAWISVPVEAALTLI
jgi:hypothetical protein